MSVRELHSSLVSDPLEGGIKEARDANNNIIISDYITFNIAIPIKKMLSRYKAMCGCECFIYVRGIYSPSLSWREWYLKKIKDQSQNA